MPFAPVIAIEATPPAPKAPPALVATVTQKNGESAIRSVAVVFPKAFTYNEAFTVPRCQPPQEAEEACPPESKLGTVKGVSPLAPAEGEVFVTDDLRLVSFVKAAGGLLQFTVTGTITLDPSGGFSVKFEGLPNIALTSLTLDLEGGERALVKNPGTCGDFPFTANFDSFDGDVVTQHPTVSITGCPPRLAITGVRATKRERGVSLRWTASAGTKATQVVLRRTGRTVRTRTVTGTRTRFAKLKPGRYVAILRATADGTRSKATREAFTVSR